MTLKRRESEQLALKTPPTNIPEWKSYLEIWIHSIKGSARSFIVSFLLRGGVSFVIRLFAVLKRKMSLVQAFKASIGTETLRFSTMVGTFSFLWKLVSNSLHFGTKIQSKRNGAIAGAIAGLAVLVESPENRVAIAQQFFMRSMQAGKNALKQRQLLSIPHGDTLLFSFGVASIMYAYAMRPNTIPREYYHWVINAGKVPRVMLELNRSNTTAVQQGIRKVDLEQVGNALKMIKATPENTKSTFDYIEKHGYMPHVPCSCLHGTENRCSVYCASVWYKTFVEMIPVYLSLNAVPTLIFKFKSVIENPISSLKRIVKATAQSCSFLSTYVALFQMMCCVHRNVYPTAHEKYLFYYLGAITGLSILVEQKPKRAELAMYVLPKGLQSLYTLMIANGAMIRIPYIDVMSTSVAMSIIMSLYQKEPYQLSSLMYKFMKSVIGTY